MQIAMNATKTYQKWLIENPDFYDPFINGGLIDAGTVTDITDTFTNRIICDDIEFTRFFRRRLKATLPRYNKLVRLENTKFDAMVSNYTERQVGNSRVLTGENSGTNNETMNGVSTDDASSDSNSHNITSRTEAMENQSNGSENVQDARNNVKSTEEQEAEETSKAIGRNRAEENERESDEVNKAMNKNAPMNASYSGATAGKLPDMDWTHASGQEQRENGTTENESRAESEMTEEDGSRVNGKDNEEVNAESGESNKQTSQNGSEEKAGSEEQEQTGSGTDSRAGATQQERNGQNEGRNESAESNLTQEIMTGRSGLTPQEALLKAAEWIKKSSAFEWLVDELEECFLGVYDI